MEFLLSSLKYYWSDINGCHIANVINKDISNNNDNKYGKTATVRPIFEKIDRTEIKNYKPLNLLNIFTRIYETWWRRDKQKIGGTVV